MNKLNRVSLLLMVAVTIASGLVDECNAEPGEFWYGLFGTATGSTWGDGVYDSMKTRYKMNWAFDRTRSQAMLSLAVVGLCDVRFQYSVQLNQMAALDVGILVTISSVCAILGFKLERDLGDEEVACVGMNRRHSSQIIRDLHGLERSGRIER